MRIIVLTGISNSGKSTTLNLLYNMIVPNLGQSQNNRVVLGNPIQNDFSETLTYHNEIVEFFTMGDYPQPLRIAIRNAANRNTNVFICACSRLDNRLIQELQKHRTAFISKSVTINNLQELAFNTADAQTIFNLI
jgi:ABC-type transport system involved in cytochrome bd biosynthesis fused ATPase/permease subunit